MNIAAESILHAIPPGLRGPLLEEFAKMVRNFREGRWEPAELNGGKLSEIVYTILSGHVSGKFSTKPSKPKNMLDACKALEGVTGFSRSVRIQIPRMLISLYEIRNNRNVGHVGSDVDPNHMDAVVVLSMSKWIIAELIRIFHTVSTDEAAEVVEFIVDRTIPVLWAVDDKVRVLNPKLSARDKTLLLLYGRLGRKDVKWLMNSVEYQNVTQYKSKILKNLHKEKLIEFNPIDGSVQLSPLGVRYVEKSLPLEM